MSKTLAQALEVRIDPRRSRMIFASLLLGALLLVCTVTLLSLRFVAQSEQAAFRERMRSDALILEAHASRALDTVVARLRSLAAMATPEALAARPLSSSVLRDMIMDDNVLRSVSLIDEDGVVQASSSEDNVGARVPALVLPGEEGARLGSRVRFGSVWPQRDLRDFTPGAAAPASQARSLIAVADAEHGVPLRIVAVINLGVFQTLWAQVDDEDAHELALFDTSGQRWVTHHGFVSNDNELRATIETVVRQDPVGEVVLPEQGHLVSYRASPRHPFVMTVIGDFARLSQHRTRQIWTFVGVAGLACALVTLLLLALFRGYRRYEAAVIEMGNQARAISAHLLVSESSRDGVITSVNANYAAACGYQPEELIGQNHRIFNSGVHPESYYKRLWETVLAGRTWKGTFRNRRKDGKHYWLMATIVPFVDAWGKVERFVAIYTDITESMTLTRAVQEERRQREELARLNRSLLTAAHTDPLTGLANRRGFDSFVAQMMASRPTGGQAAAVLMMDLDRFKSVNDTYGHGAGDEVLKEMARRWVNAIRDSDLLARLGGEEFCIVLPGADLEAATRVGEAVRQLTAAAPVSITHEGAPFPLPVTVSVGVAWAGDLQSQELAAMMEVADEALYEAKEGGRNRVSTRTVKDAPPA